MLKTVRLPGKPHKKALISITIYDDNTFEAVDGITGKVLEGKWSPMHGMVGAMLMLLTSVGEWHE